MKRLLFLSTIFITSYAFENNFMRFINYDCYALQDNARQLTFDEIRHRLQSVVEKEVSLTGAATLLATCIMGASIKLFEDPRKASKMIPHTAIVLTGATIAGYCIAIRRKALQNVKDTLRDSIISNSDEINRRSSQKTAAPAA